MIDSTLPWKKPLQPRLLLRFPKPLTTLAQNPFSDPFAFMDDYRSNKSHGVWDGNMEIQSYHGGKPSSSLPPHDYKSYSASSSSVQQTQVANYNYNNTDLKTNKGKKTTGSSSSSKIWCFNDPELQRKKRVASYKVYSVEGQMKGSFTKSYRWLKDRYTKVVHGWWW